MVSQAARRTLSQTLLSLAAASLATGASPAFAVVSPLTQDTFTQSSAPTTLHGGWASVNVNGAGARGLLEFELSAVLPTGASAAIIQKASLILFVEWMDAAGSIELLRLTGSFSESSTTHATFPIHTGLGTGKTVALQGSVRPLVVDVTDLVRAALTAGQTKLGLAILPSQLTPTVAVQLGAKEGRRPALLDITLAAPSPSTFWATSTANVPCSTTCAGATPPASAVADVSGNVCARPDNSRFRATQFRSTIPAGQVSTWACGEWLGSNVGFVGIGNEGQRIAQCHCAR
jgi:hypothetical protein